MHYSDRCKCLSPLTKAGAQVWEREQRSGPTHQAGGIVRGPNLVRRLKNLYFGITVGLKLGAHLRGLCFAFEVLLCLSYVWKIFCEWINRILRLKSQLPALSCCDALPYTPLVCTTTQDTTQTTEYLNHDLQSGSCARNVIPVRIYLWDPTWWQWVHRYSNSYQPLCDWRPFAPWTNQGKMEMNIL